MQSQKPFTYAVFGSFLLKNCIVIAFLFKTVLVRSCKLVFGQVGFVVC